MTDGLVVQAMMGPAWAMQPEALESLLATARRQGAGPEALAAKLGRTLPGAAGVTMRGSVAVVPVVGPIFRYADAFTDALGLTTTEETARAFTSAMESAAVRSVVLEIDSPGGELTGMNELAKLIAAARGSKPVLAYVGGMAASGAYWLASAADEIVADETAMLGSVGVVLTARRKDPQSAVVEIVSSQSPRKRLDAETPAGQAGLQELANELAGIFVRSIAGYRGVSEQHVLERFGKGGLLLGAKAVEAGMVDRIGTLEGVIAELQQGRKPKRASATAPGAAASVSTSGNRTAAPVKTEAQLEAETLAFINRTMRGKDGAEAEEQEFQQMRARFAPGQKPKRRSMAEIMAAEVEEAADGDSQTPLSNEDETKTLHFIEEVLKGAY